MKKKGCLGVIPARGGSKRLPNKNILEFYGQPIISYSIDTLLKTELFNQILVSTDSKAIANIAKAYGANVPFLRSKTASDDFSTLTDVLLEVIREMSEIGLHFDYICCMLPTSVLVPVSKISEGFELIRKGNYSSVVSVMKYASPIQRAFIKKEGLLKMSHPEFMNTRTQDLDSSYFDCGQFYWIKVSDFLAEKKIFMDKLGSVELSEFEGQDVDNPEDWRILEYKYTFANGEIIGQ